MSRTRRSPVRLLAVLAASVTLLVAAAPRPAAAASRCEPAPGSRLAPHLLSPCDGATVRSHHAVTFTVYDPERESAADAPYLDLMTTRTLLDGHLALSRDGDGIFAQMTSVAGHPHLWTYTATQESYAGWWDDRARTVSVQIDQVDSRVSAGIVYGPITSLRVR